VAQPVRPPVAAAIARKASTVAAFYLFAVITPIPLIPTACDTCRKRHTFFPPVSFAPDRAVLPMTARFLATAVAAPRVPSLS
jgi:hypothetical protein